MPPAWEACAARARLYHAVPCNECAKARIQSGIREVIYYERKYPGSDSVIASKRMFDMVGVTYKRKSGCSVTRCHCDGPQRRKHGPLRAFLPAGPAHRLTSFIVLLFHARPSAALVSAAGGFFSPAFSSRLCFAAFALCTRKTSGHRKAFSCRWLCR